MFASRVVAADPADLLEIGRPAKSEAERLELEEPCSTDLIEHCIVELIERGRRPILFRPETATWQWTDILNGFGGDEGDSPETIAATAIGRWAAFGASDVGLIWFGTEVPPKLPPFRAEEHMRNRLDDKACRLAPDKLAQVVEVARAEWGKPKASDDRLGRRD